MTPLRVVHLSAEVSPYAKTGGLGDVVGALPAALRALGHEVTVFAPLHRQAREASTRLGLPLAPEGNPFHIELGYRAHEIALYTGRLPGTDVPVHFVASDPHFDRPAVYHADARGEDDGLRRFAVFVRGALEAMRRLRLVPDVLHAHDWHTALAPMAVAWDRPTDPHFAQTATVLTLHNVAFQGAYDRGEYLALGLPQAVEPETEWRGRLNLLKGGVLAADAITAVSPGFARELATHEGGFGLDPIFCSRGDALVGIVNGIDRAVWNPTQDPYLPERYSAADLAGKAEDRRTLLTMAGMDTEDPGLVVGLIGRLTEQKGFDLFFAAAPTLVAEGVRFVVLGEGEPALEGELRALMQGHRHRAWGYVGFDEALAHLIEAGADALLMPSRFEPCGLAQLYALAYGTPPIVRRVGGLADTVVGYDGKNLAQATGFGFDPPTVDALIAAVRQARQTFADQGTWRRLVENGMAQDFSWEHSARSYEALYRRLESAPTRP